tara:strand:- start:734 stop:1819 length:1086 start_codon:yes stop_codon:yes gene_type:complete
MKLNRRNIDDLNIWPGFVDILGTLLIVTIFTILISTVTQVYFNDQLELKRGEISSLDNQVQTLLNEIETTNLERKKLSDRISSLIVDLKTLKKDKIILMENVRSIEKDLAKSNYLIKIRENELNKITEEKTYLLGDLQDKNSEISNINKKNKQFAFDIVELNKNVRTLKKKISSLESILKEAENNDEKNKIKIKNLGKRLNQALAGKVQELSEFQSIFFRKIREAIGDRNDIRISGDRFILPSEILFKSGSDVIEPDGVNKLMKISKSLKEISTKIPQEIDWILRIDGHTDKIPINNKEFSSNWHLSSSRSINIVKFFINEGISPNRLVAAGFGEYSPIFFDQTDDSLKKNRRIEIKLSTR